MSAPIHAIQAGEGGSVPVDCGLQADGSCSANPELPRDFPSASFGRGRGVATGVISRPLRLPQRSVETAGRCLLMGILNINDDSFSGDGRVDAEWAMERAVALIGEGADIIDVGAESARTNRRAISVGEEESRLRPFLAGWPEVVARARRRDDRQVFPPVLSLNTWRPEVVGRTIGSGVELLNDMGGLPDSRNATLCAAAGCALLILHTVGLPKQKHTHVRHENLLAEVESYFRAKMEVARLAGVPADALVLDPGPGFAKQHSDDLALLAGIESLARIGPPLLLPVSRKGFIGKVLGVENVPERDAGTVACCVRCMAGGASILRVHNVDAVWRARRTIEFLTGEDR